MNINENISKEEMMKMNPAERKELGAKLFGDLLKRKPELRLDTPTEKKLTKQEIFTESEKRIDAAFDAVLKEYPDVLEDLESPKERIVNPERLTKFDRTDDEPEP